MTAPARRSWLFDAAVLALAAGGLALVLLLPGAHAPATAALARGYRLTGEATSAVYGYGPELGVSVPVGDRVAFELAVAAEPPALYQLVLESSGIEARDEVAVSVNGMVVAFLRPDGAAARRQRLKLPPRLLRPGSDNEIAFRQLRRRAGLLPEPWAIRGVHVQVRPLPRGGPSDLILVAQRAHDRAAEVIARRELSAAEWRSVWTELADAQLHLEGVEPKPGLYGLVQNRLREAERILDALCRGPGRSGLDEDFCRQLERERLEDGVEVRP